MRLNQKTNNFHESNVEMHNLNGEQKKYDKLKIQPSWGKNPLGVLLLTTL